VIKRVLALSVALSFLAAGCTKQTTGGAGTAAGGGTTGAAGVTVGADPPFVNTSTTEQNSFTIPHVLRLTDEEDIETLNPLLTSDTSVTLILAPLSMGYLIRWDKNAQPIPELVTQVPTQQNGGVSKDGLTVTYHIRKGVKWSDGAPFDADDVIFSFKAVLNPNNNVTSRQGWDHITKMDEPDKYTVVLHFNKPYSPFLETFFSTAGANPALLPKHLLAQYPNLNNVPYNAKPVGIGPFMVKEWSRGSRVVLVQNPYYFRGLPKLKEIDFEIITNANTVLTELQAKSLDMFWYAPQNMVDQFAALQPFVTWAQPGYYFRHIDFNLRSPKLSDHAVREALRMAIDRPTILAKLYHNIGILQEQPAPKVSAYWDPNIQMVPFDVAKANQLLDQAGWKRGADGIRAKNGVRLDLNFVTATGTVINDQLIELVRSTWNKLGVNLTVSHYLNTLLFAQYQDGGILYRGKYDLAYYAWGQDAFGDFSSIYGCDQIPPAGQNSIFWCNRRADKAMHDFFSHYNQADRNKDDSIVMTELIKDVPTIVTLGTANLWVYNRDVKNLDPGALSPFDNFMNVDI